MKRFNTATCLLDDGTYTEYHACSIANKDVYDPSVFKCIGKGEILTAGKSVYYGKIKRYFYKRIEN